MADQNPEPIEVSIVAKMQGLLDGFAKGGSAGKEFTDGMGKNLGGLGEIAEGMGSKFAGITELGASLGPAIIAVAALALAFKAAETAVDFVKESVEYTLELAEQFKDLAYQTGLSADELMQWKIAANLEGGNITVLEQAVRGASRAIGSNSQFLIDNGIAANRAQLQAMPFQDYLETVLKRADDLAPGLERNQLLTKALGRAGVEAAPQLKEMVERMDEAKKLGEEYGVVIGQDDIQAMEDFKGNLGQFTTAWEALKTQVGEAVIPILNQFLGMLVDYLPQAVNLAKEMILGTIAGFLSLAETFVTVDEYGDALANTVGVGIVGALQAAAQAANGDFAGAAATMKATGAAVADSWKQATANIDAYEQYASDTIQSVYSKLYGQAPAYKAPQGTGKVKDRSQDDQASQLQLQAFKLELEQKKDAEDSWFTWSAQKELEFWQEKEGQVQKGTTAYLAILTEENKLRRKIAEENQAKAKADFDLAMSKVREGSDERVTLATQEAERLKGVYGADSKEYTAALAKAEAEKQKHADKMRQVDDLVRQNERDAQLDGLQNELAILQDEESAGLITKQKLIEAEMAYEKRMYQIKLQEAKDAALAEPDPVKHQQLLNKIEQLERQHDSKMGQLARQAAQDQRATYNTWFNGITSGFSKAIDGLIKGTMTWGQAFKSVLSDMGDFLIQQSEQMAMKWVADRLYEMIFGKTTREADVIGAASVYAVNAMASVAAIPVTGWAMAPGVGAEAFATGMSFLPSAAQGWDRVPQDTIAQIHKDEMVMSAPLAQGVRDMIAGGKTGGGGVTHQHHYHINAMDSQSFEHFLRRNTGALVKVSNEAVGNRRMTR